MLMLHGTLPCWIWYNSAGNPQEDTAPLKDGDFLSLLEMYVPRNTDRSNKDRAEEIIYGNVQNSIV